jgi:hypothetical protein
MGIKLVEEVMDWCPDDVTPAQRWCLTVLARDANDSTRETWHGPEHPEILRRVRMTPKRWEATRSALLKRGLIEAISGGYRGKTVRYRIASMFAPCVIQDWRKTPEERGAFGGYAAKLDQKAPRKTGVNEHQSPPQNEGQSGERPPQNGGPTPPSCSSPPTSSPDAAGRPTPTAPLAEVGREGGGSAARNNQPPPGYLALARLTAKDPRLTVGETELAELAPLAATWLERAPADRLEAALTGGLPTAIANPAGFLRGRLVKKLPPPRIPEEAKERCTDPNCNPVTQMVTLPDHSIDFCPICHPTGRARARRTQGAAA